LYSTYTVLPFIDVCMVTSRDKTLTLKLGAIKENNNKNNITLPLKLEHIDHMHEAWKINSILGPLRDLVRMSTSCSLKLTNSLIRSFDNNFSLTK